MSSERWAYLDLADFLLIAEATLGVSTDDLIRVTQLHLPSSALDAPAAEFGGVEFYPDVATKVAVLCSRIVKNHALPDGTSGSDTCAPSSSPSATGSTGNPLRGTIPAATRPSG